MKKEQKVAIGIRRWSKYKKPYQFNITVQTLDEINKHVKEKNNEHFMSKSQSRYVF